MAPSLEHICQAFCVARRGTAQLSSARLGSRLLICNELCMPRLAVRIGSIVGRWYNRIVGELLPLTVARVRFMARQIACNAYIIMIIIYYKANVYITRRLSKLCGRSHSKGGRTSKGEGRGRFGYLRMLFRYFAITMQLQ